MTFVEREEEVITIEIAIDKKPSLQYELFLLEKSACKLTYKLEVAGKVDDYVIIIGILIINPNLSHYRFALEKPEKMLKYSLEDRVAIEEAIAILNRKYGAY